ncbi:glycosyltransferase [Flavobacterium branchiophilum]|uniref:Dolichol-phosphate mannosyltransferase n=1 Tax=Flavobacterium branchiophilum TaxID=55197 RepID=A0A543G0U9_9FLAO|nr:glycosyltransferase family 2 protein [Flavobacterium branchiophilum]OXA77447.1 glycosyltransferase [Flavobacterium branchiophilum] [Flavobacterium branchiophilum NBRC 15030 = ATCC 35035]TQM39718.1 dolichol-phosphate mannosyltransferase [Flavobacterium branchiophilum]GEM55615.1 glycosyl transferase [Flavobacterium branchiophilum NBRC 15030 = ATCC 35035]
MLQNTSNSTKIDISIIVPLYNEEVVFDKLIDRLKNTVNSVDFNCEVVLIDDGSSDRTPQFIQDVCKHDVRFTGLFLSRNYGHQFAVTAGFNYARAEKGIMIIDGDLQDPPELITDFYNLLTCGYDVIYGVRKNRKENFLKRYSYLMYYRLQKKISNFNIPIDSGDFSMLSRRVVDNINNMPEQNRYIRGMRAWVGFKQIGFEYDREERQGGESKYSLKSLLELAITGIFNFSDFPIRFITKLGLFTILLSLMYFVYNLYRKVFYNDVPQGFSAILLAIIMFSGVQLISLGLIGEYVLKIYNQVRNRPLYVIDKIVQDGKKIEIEHKKTL